MRAGVPGRPRHLDCETKARLTGISHGREADVHSGITRGMVA